MLCAKSLRNKDVSCEWISVTDFQLSKDWMFLEQRFVGYEFSLAGGVKRKAWLDGASFWKPHSLSG